MPVIPLPPHSKGFFFYFILMSLGHWKQKYFGDLDLYQQRLTDTDMCPCVRLRPGGGTAVLELTRTCAESQR